ncbi:hypothetical protein PAL_GLEAN10003623 [Pteropus alecto]|uniref:Uncharacterized protein n=1 Tax=Pteropus alecto TaxID=9402 RepID=L5L5Z1_PTEAL|nr:hypothetical protein PAL_GLEAN10003623 [Pteropus alecto]
MGDRHKLGPAVLLLRREACPQRLRVPAWATRSPKAVCVEKMPLSLWPVTAALGATGFRGVADEDAFLEECRQRGQPASARSLRSHKPAALPRHASPPHGCEDEDEQGRHRAAGSWDPSVFSAGVQRETEAGRPCRAASPPAQGQGRQKAPLRCCVLT